MMHFSISITLCVKRIMTITNRNMLTSNENVIQGNPLEYDNVCSNSTESLLVDDSCRRGGQ